VTRKESGRRRATVASAEDLLVEFALTVDPGSIDRDAAHAMERSFVDSVGCIIGGSTSPVVARATEAFSPFFSGEQAVLLGQSRRADPPHAALINGLAGASYSFFDSYSAAHLHAGVPLAAAVLAATDLAAGSGADLLAAYGAGLEVACRITRAIAVGPAHADVGWSIGGIVCGIAASLAVSRILALGPGQSLHALGIAASQAAGTRSEHGTMTAGLVFGHAAEVGVRSAILASRGFTSSASLQGPFGFVTMFSRAPRVGALIADIGQRFDCVSVSFKPYPTDIAIHAAIDAMIELRRTSAIEACNIARIEVRVSELAHSFCDRPDPIDDLEAKFSLQHWVAVAALRDTISVADGSAAAISDPDAARLRALISLDADPALDWDSAELTVELVDGTRACTRIAHCAGSPGAPMTDADLTAKFLAQAERTLGAERAREVAGMCWEVARLPDAATITRAAA
jgi:2-methylcitrate dehydratase PrpD